MADLLWILRCFLRVLHFVGCQVSSALWPSRHTCFLSLFWTVGPCSFRSTTNLVTVLPNFQEFLESSGKGTSCFCQHCYRFNYLKIFLLSLPRHLGATDCSTYVHFAILSNLKHFIHLFKLQNYIYVYTLNICIQHVVLKND